MNPDQREWVAALADQLTIAQVAAVLRAIGETLQHIDRNVNVRLALDVLLLKLPRLPSG
jgi:hypothetical protein